MKPVYPLTPSGAILLQLTRFFFKILGWFKGNTWKTPLPCFEEDPRYFTATDSLYLGYKYYLAPHTDSGTQGRLEHHFANQQLEFPLPAGFKITQTLSIAAGGDLMPYAVINQRSAAHIWEEVGDWYFGANLVTANLETPIVPERKPSLVPEVMLNHMLFNGNEEQWQIFNGNGKYRGLDIVSTANNHSQDQGIAGLERTLEFLDQHKVAHTGTFARQQQQPLVLEQHGIKVGFLAWTFSQNQFANPDAEPWRVNHLRFNRPGIDLSPLLAEVKSARLAGAEFLVLHLHAGCAYQAYPSAHIVEQYHRILETTGIDVILGGHPHNPQPMEAYSYKDPFSGSPKKSFVIYSLGDFVAYDIFTWCHLPMLLKLHIVAGTGDTGRQVLLNKVEAMPVFNALWKSTAGPEIRFLPLLQTGTLKNTRLEQERQYLKAHWEQYLRQEGIAWV